MSLDLINFDANASYGLLAEVNDELQAQVFACLNPSSIHQGGQRARSLIESARASVKQLVNANDDIRLIFTSGATEANNLALSIPAYSTKRQEVICSKVEHPSVLEFLNNLKKRQMCSVNYLSPELILNMAEQVSEKTALISCMLANNESGHVYPVSDIFMRAKAINPAVFCHCDAVQSVGKMEVSFSDTNCDSMTLSGHKIGALAGIGALLVKDDFQAAPVLFGGPQEMRWRAGTENLIGIVSMGIAARLAKKEVISRSKQMQKYIQKIINTLNAEVSAAQILFRNETDDFLPNTLSVRFPGVKADDLVVAVDLAGVCVSAGSACASGKPLPSHVLMAYGLSEDQAREVIRISLPHTLNEQDLERGLGFLVEAVKRMQTVAANYTTEAA